MVKLNLPGGVVESSRKMMLLIAATASVSPPLFVSKRIEPPSGYASASGTEKAAGQGSASRLSFGIFSTSAVKSTSSRANFAAFLNSLGGVQSFHLAVSHSGKSFSAPAFAALI